MRLSRVHLTDFVSAKRYVIAAKMMEVYGQKKVAQWWISTAHTRFATALT